MEQHSGWEKDVLWYPNGSRFWWLAGVVTCIFSPQCLRSVGGPRDGDNHPLSVGGIRLTGRRPSASRWCVGKDRTEIYRVVHKDLPIMYTCVTSTVFFFFLDRHVKIDTHNVCDVFSLRSVALICIDDHKPTKFKKSNKRPNRRFEIGWSERQRGDEVA